MHTYIGTYITFIRYQDLFSSMVVYGVNEGPDSKVPDHIDDWRELHIFLNIYYARYIQMGRRLDNWNEADEEDHHLEFPISF